MSAPDGLLIVDKPAGWTSHDVVARARRLCGTRKVGHAGTLDPMATGVLVLGVGRATKLLTFLVGCDKAYDATIRLGASTLTDDAEGEQTAYADPSGIDEDVVRQAIDALTGEIDQVPSAVSAIKIKGERAYSRVRQGEDVELPARRITVSRFDIHQVTPARCAAGPVLDVEVSVEVSSGTYVRALARDLGAALGVGGHLTALRRTRVGGYGLQVAHPLADLESLAEQEQSLPILPMAQAARAQFPVHEVTSEQQRALGYGQRIESALRGEPVVAAITADGALVAMLDETRRQARSHVVFS